MVFFTGNRTVELFVNLPMAGIDTAITDHLIMLFRNMPDGPFYEIHNRNGFFHIPVIFVLVVMESDKAAVIFVNPGCGDDGATGIAANIFDGCLGTAFVWLCIYVETFFVLSVTAGFDFFKGRSDRVFHFVKQGGAEGIAQECVVEVIDVTPKTIIAVTAFRNETVDMGIPF